MYLSTVIIFCLSVAVSGVYGEINCADLNEQSSMVPKNNEEGQSKYTILGFKIEAEMNVDAFDVYVHDEFNKEHLCYRYNGGNLKVLQEDCSQPIDGIYITFRTAGDRKLKQVCKIWAIGVARCPAGTKYKDGTCAQAQSGMKCYQNTDCSGYDIVSTFNMPMTPAACKSKCLGDVSCRGFTTHHRTGAMRCWHKYYACSAAQRAHLSGGTWCEKPTVEVAGCFQNSDCPGYDIVSTSNTPMTQATCKSKCLGDVSCRGYLTYYRENAMRCWHKYYACSASQRKPLSGATWCEKPLVEVAGCYQNTDCPGYDIASTHNTPMTPANCKARCMSDASCHGYLTYYRESAMRCWHKNHACTGGQRKPLSGATWCKKPSADSNCYQNTDCPGYDIVSTSNTPMTPADCKARCLGNGSCRGYLTYHRAGAMRCWHKHHACSDGQRRPLAGATWCENPPVTNAGCFQNTDCPGFDIATISNTPMAPAGCKSACLSNASCRGYLTYYRAGAMRCWHKHHACSAPQRKPLSGATWCAKL